MLVKDLGEFGLIGRIAKLLPDTPPDVVVGIGDDVAVLKTSGPDYLLATCDIQAEGVHFTRGAITPYQLGRRAVAINVSDIAAMGGNPLWALVSLAIPETTDVAFIEELYCGMREQAGLAGASIVGGNLSRSGPGIAIDITLLGQIAPARLVLRSGAREGDAVLVTGFPGDSRAGFELTRRPDLRVSEPARKRVLERHLTPQPRLREGQALARSGLVRAMVDVSDGLLADLGHVCAASGTGAVIEAGKAAPSDAAAEVFAACEAEKDRGCKPLPQSEEISRKEPLPGIGALTQSGVLPPIGVLARMGVLEWVLAGGEDYELLFTAAPESVPRIQKMLLDETGTPCREIGRITGEPGVLRLVMPDGTQAVLPPGRKGWDHFAGGG
ncbi:MAG: thiamine-phosphate kinase [Syntrophobacteraceae bacterium]